MSILYDIAGFVAAFGLLIVLAGAIALTGNIASRDTEALRDQRLHPRRWPYQTYGMSGDYL